jgi:hypothetical protein
MLGEGFKKGLEKALRRFGDREEIAGREPEKTRKKRAG